MRYYTHVVFGVLCAVVLGAQSVLFYGGLMLGIFFPDIDNASSKLGKKIKPVSWLLQHTVGHRGVLHSLFVGVAGALGVALVSVDAGYGFAAGYGSHLLADSLTPAGVAWLYPLKVRMRGPIKTGSFLEIIFLVVSILLTSLLLLRG